MLFSVINSYWFCFQIIKNHFPQTFLEVCKYKQKEKETKPLINDDLESFPDDGCVEKKNFEENFE